MSTNISSSFNAVNSTPTSTAPTSTSTTGSSSNSLINANTFLQLLVDEMQNQNPLQPMNNSEIMSQMSELANVQAISQMTQNIQNMQTTMSAMGNMVQGLFSHQLLGASVTVRDSSGNQVSGTVSSISFTNDTPSLVINNQTYPLSSLVSMT